MKRFSLIAFLLFFPVTVKADDKANDPLPNQSELLPAPRKLSGECSGIEVVEWRPSRFHPDITSPSEQGFRLLDATCQEVMTQYSGFAVKSKLKFEKKRISARIMMMPANSRLDGAEGRNLNDSKGRFLNVTQGDCCFWGIFDRNTNSIFLRNDPVLRKQPVNKYFVRTFVHELSHVLNFHWKIRELNFPKSYSAANDMDEEVAESFVVAFGIRYTTDYSEANLTHLEER